MIKKLYYLGMILLSVPFIVVGGSTLYTMFLIEPTGTLLNISFVLGAALIVLSWYLKEEN